MAVYRFIALFPYDKPRCFYRVNPEVDTKIHESLLEGIRLLEGLQTQDPAPVGLDYESMGSTFRIEHYREEDYEGYTYKTVPPTLAERIMRRCDSLGFRYDVANPKEARQGADFKLGLENWERVLG